MLKLFFDTNIVMALVMSQSGASYELYRLALEEPGQLQLCISDYVFLEAEEVFTRQNKPKYLAQLETIKHQPVWMQTTTTVTEDDKAGEVVNDPDDAVIIAGAKKAKVNALVSFDRKHLHTKTVANYIGAPVVTAGEALQMVRDEQTK